MVVENQVVGFCNLPIQMAVIILFLFLVTIFISVPTAAQQVLYVLPDNSTNTSCQFQPCATLSQYLLDNNGSLPVVSNVEYHFLPGEHYIPTNMTLQYLHNFTMTGRYDYTSIPLIVGGLISYLKVFNSVNVSIENVIFEKHDVSMISDENYYDDMYNLAFTNCLSCKINNSKFLKYGFRGEHLVGESYLNDIVMELADTPLCCFGGIYLTYPEGFSDKYHSECMQLVINRISMTSIETYYVFTYNVGIHIQLPVEINFANVFTILIANSSFFNMTRKVLDIVASGCTNYNIIMIENCTFRYNEHLQILADQWGIINGELPHLSVTLTFTKCQFFENEGLILLSVDVNFCWSSNNASFALSSKIVIMNCSFYNNHLKVIQFHSSNPSLHAEICINGPVYIFGNTNEWSSSEIMEIDNFNVHIKGPVYILNNAAEDGIMFINAILNNILLDGIIVVSNNTAFNVMQFHHSHVMFNGSITVSQNIGHTILWILSCTVTLSGPTLIFMNINCGSLMLLQYCNILFTGNILLESNSCRNIITLVSKNQKSAYIEVMEYSNITFSQNSNSSLIVVETDYNYYNIYPTCIFQYVTRQTTPVTSTSHYTIIISTEWLSNTCELSLYHFFSHCKWIPEAEFQDHKPKVINQQKIQLQHKFQYLKYHSVIFYCPNFNTNMLGPVYPGQKLQVELCIPCSDNYSILYADTHNILLPQSACKIAHQSEIVNFITNNSKIVNYTIVSEVNESCELLLTVSPFLYNIYEVFNVKLLPCPIGFTLQNGVCDCDPLLPTDIDTCYIDQSAIRRPANTWISYTQSGTSKYLISDCPMDYCLPFSSNVNLLHPIHSVSLTELVSCVHSVSIILVWYLDHQGA